MMLLLRGGRLLDPARGLDQVADVLIRDGAIAEIGNDLRAPAGARVLDCFGQVVAPGFIDLGARLGEPGQTHREDLASGTAAAARGGYVAVLALPGTQPVIDTAQLVTYLTATAARKGHVRVLAAGCLTKGAKGEEMAEIGEMAAAGAVAVGDDNKPVDAELMRLALLYSKQFGMPVFAHADTPSLAAGGSMREGAVSAVLGLKGIPASSEAACAARDLLLAEETGGRLHIRHVSSRRSIELIRAARARGVQVTCEVTPHHLALIDAELLARRYDPLLKFTPPLGDAADRQALQAALSEGVIDAIASDHAPLHADEKDLEFLYAAAGASGLDTAVPVCLDLLVNRGVIKLEQLILAMSTNPARILGQTPPTLLTGAPADITVLDLGRQTELRAEDMASRSTNTPFLGSTLTGAPVATIVRGRLAMLDGQVVTEEVATLG